VKFLCDRCKTRYSIGDDRVRGKILKIRCKNCQNVITVREGMSDAGAPVAAASDGIPAVARRGRTTTGAPQPHISLPDRAASSSLGAAFVQQLAKPPPALEEEWYVSLDGHQQGPLSLVDAQRWVSDKSFDAELHCWSEGFDDWLPVDKVSHFRGLRRKPRPPTSPPPLPRAAPPRQPEDEPKSLFAATMAALERATTATGPGLVDVAAAPALPRVNGGGAPRPQPFASVRSTTTPGVVPTPAPVAARSAGGLAQAFDSSDSATLLEPFEEDPATRAEPLARRQSRPHLPLDPASTLPSAPTPAMLDAARPTGPIIPNAATTAPMMPPASDGAPEDDENLEIGEVSRVVKLADIARTPRPVGRATGAHARLRGTGSIPPINAPGAPMLGAPVVGAPPDAAAPATRAHRRNLAILLGVAALLLVGGVAVLLVVNSSDANEPKSRDQSREFETSHADVTVPTRPGTTDVQPPPTGSATSQKLPPRKTGNSRITSTNPMPQETVDPSKSPLEASEVEDMAAKQSAGTRRCYDRAQRGVSGLEIGDLKRLSVVLSVDKDGSVTNVKLSEHADDTLGKCLVGQIRRWKFRESQASKDFGITLVFGAS
jgi:predicted Zn finger-like uncharacterized protein